eukprot:14089479-Ditylum_brightwellii.AAC.1
MDGNPITQKFKKKEVKNAGKSAQAFTQFLLNSAAMGGKYADVDKCWKRTPKLDYLVLKDDRTKKQKSRGADTSKAAGPAIEIADEWSEISNGYPTGEEEQKDNLSETEEGMQPNDPNGGTKFIRKHSHRMDAVGKKMEVQEEEKQLASVPDKQDLLKSILERTAQLEAKASSVAPQE